MKFLYFYQLAYICAVFFLLPLLTVLILFKKSYRACLHQRFTLYSCDEKRILKSKRGSVWIHASSVGEVKLVSGMFSGKSENIFITTTSFAGKKTAEKLLPSAESFLMPLDLIFMWKRFLNFLRPKKLFIAETELWPGLVFSPVEEKILFNGRMSDEKFSFYLKGGEIMKAMLKEFKMIFAKDKENARRFLKAGADKSRIREMGNLKFLEQPSQKPLNDPRYRTGEFPVIVAGSTHRGEEDIIIDCVSRFRKKHPHTALILSPRYVSRSDEIRASLEKKGFDCSYFSQKKEGIKKGENIVVDTTGELALIYSLATIAFVGGTFDSTGGHNVIEPAVWGVPVVVGPSYRNFKHEVNYLRESGGLKVAKNPHNLYYIIERWLSSRAEGSQAGRSNLKAVRQKRMRAQEALRELKSFV
ncbi:MAG: 3-deoxy-D-manno-octulosonic acid transferase [Elusimicrobiota bacterium]